jgi:hypothetical protein
MEHIGLKITNFILLIIVGILTSMSIVAVLAIHMDLSKQELIFSPESVNVYIASFGEYESLFAATLGVAGAYFAFLQLKSAVNTYKDKIRYDYFTEWKITLEIRLREVEADEPYMNREFTKLRYQLFLQLYEMKFSILTREQLEQVFEQHFKNEVGFLETKNKKHEGMGGIYPDQNYSYSFDNFRFVFLGCLNNFYEKIEADLQSIYVKNLPKPRTIDQQAYVFALKNYRNDIKII